MSVDSALNRVLEPSVLMEMRLSDGKIHTFEVQYDVNLPEGFLQWLFFASLSYSIHTVGPNPLY